jgi:predicted HTH domain antitoxin
MSDTFQLTVELPQTVKDLLPNAEQELKQYLAVKLYQNQSVSIGKAAEIACMDTIEFQYCLAAQKIPISNLSFEQVMADADAVSQDISVL